MWPSQRASTVSKPRANAEIVYEITYVGDRRQPVPTHALAATPCMLHLLTGSEDGYVRDYDIFSAVNGKVFLSAPQRHHAGVVEGIMKAGQIRSWWENTVSTGDGGDLELSPVHSLAIHSDALWGLAGTNVNKPFFLLACKITDRIIFRQVM